ncbi:hypothetical protein [Stackebrandtia nassauensis]|uniref:Uncharacterized protein n=1 Tax=Stackebrandtia nassauensis (strain DSM 44728 / CIP 108903 / NRRL B-16338 / NBRC 102104 / LLR-40K-21) TaxID=446470 RepID=D3PVE1_STANL|nr:hypothetical protein [Stackebrandtia nassauensis]ADD41194.1 hypothetical protein Snas_1490 [Stackebrandtia nassauensis DSM 44728]
MGKNSDNLGADLHQLQIAGRAMLPDVGRSYSQASRDLHNVGAGYDPRQPAMGLILSFRDQIQDYFVATHHAMINNGAALVTIAKEYAKTDWGAAQKMREDWENRMASPILNEPRPPMPEPKTSADETYETTREVMFEPDPNSPSGVVEVTKWVPKR